MYEKPQYWTPEGFKRMPKNPYRTPGAMLPLQVVPEKKPANSALLAQQLRKKQQCTISDEAARMIASVLKEMLR